MTVGPNGSGKSTVVTALSVCLGGDLSSLHRQVYDTYNVADPQVSGNLGSGSGI